MLEHAVDCVLQFEGEPQRTYRTLRALKNRFGSTNEIGVFEMRSGGLTRSPTPPSASWEARPVPGSCVLCAMEGTRPLLVEVQALTAPSDVVPRDGSPMASTATASASCSRRWRATAGRPWAPRTCS